MNKVFIIFVRECMERYLLLVKFSWILNGKAKKQHPLNHQARALCDMMRSILGRKTSYKMLEGNIFLCKPCWYEVNDDSCWQFISVNAQQRGQKALLWWYAHFNIVQKRLKTDEVIDLYESQNTKRLYSPIMYLSINASNSICCPHSHLYTIPITVCPRPPPV